MNKVEKNPHDSMEVWDQGLISGSTEELPLQTQKSSIQVVVYCEGFAGVNVQDWGETEGILEKEQSTLQPSDPLMVTMVHEDFDLLQGHLINSSA